MAGVGTPGVRTPGMALFGAQYLASTQQTGEILGSGIPLSVPAEPQGGLRVLLLGHGMSLRTWPVSGRWTFREG